MGRFILWVFSLALLLTVSSCTTNSDSPEISDQSLAKTPTDSDIRLVLIERSIQIHAGVCPCPYNRSLDGSLCGKQSKYSRPGSAGLMCYESDVSDKMVQEYRRRYSIPEVLP